MRQWSVDAFAAAPFKGNPACVVQPFDAWPEAAWMQALAQENNQAETAYLLKTPDPARFGLRWFTPAVEVRLCGHASLAAAHVLFSELGLDAQEVIFDSASGPLGVRRAGDGYRMDFPADAPGRIEPAPDLTAAIGLQAQEVWSASYLVALLASEAEVRAVTPDSRAILEVSLAESGGRGDLIVAAVADEGRPYQVVSRFFAPGAGIAEDPATGSAHCILAPLFSARLGRPRLAYHQAFPGRGGDLVCEHRGARVFLEGRAVTVLESVLRV